MLAPIVLFAYNRAKSLESTVESLLTNKLSRESDLFVFVDGAKNEKDAENVEEVKEYVKRIKGFKKLTYTFSEKNKGLAASVISGVSEIINVYNKVIVVEDDLIVSSNFLNYMNDSLCYYNEYNKIFSISAYSVKINKPLSNEYDVYFLKRAHCWGWGTWKDRWETIDWALKDSDEFIKNRTLQKAFNKLGDDMSQMLINYIEKKINSWYIRFCYEQYKQNKFTVYPWQSKVVNLGFLESSTHCNVYNRFRVNFDNSNKKNHSFSNIIKSDKTINKDFLYYYSNKARIIGKLKTYLLRAGIINQYTQQI